MANCGYGTPLGGMRSHPYQAPNGGISLDPKLLSSIDRIEKMLEKITERLAILEDPDPEHLAQHKMLKEAYTKYLFLEKLCEQEGADES